MALGRAARGGQTCDASQIPLGDGLAVSGDALIPVEGLPRSHRNFQNLAISKFKSRNTMMLWNDEC
jgi:hypothetical protein